ncbi:hypothetical protein CABS01_16679 [Colletotrichum abscissum]|uniref:uncharacterized protein n=1 Tax=Colletotrichum abscissum TaxID=1671311 RepID=UPI0027D7065F|nr:uncharacterized protein CABS01_16679 [Colletotrichum abscissum]KAK1517376.1 hypothetical protein CABS01_16679 [Colletotrichum abscissum]
MPRPSECSANWVNRQMSQFDDWWDDLRMVQASLGRLGDVERAIEMAALLKPSTGLALNQFMKRFEQLEKTSKKRIDWKHLENWIANAQDHLRRDFEETAQWCELLQIDVSGLEVEDVITKLTEHTLRRSVGRLFGPNWQKRLVEINRAMGIDLTSSDSINMNREQFWRAVSLRKTQILQQLDKIKKRQGSLPTFRKIWARLDIAARMQILRKCDIPEAPDTHIYSYLERVEEGHSTALHFCPALNYVDLSESDNLPSLLETRCKVPPHRFRPSDGRYLLLSLWAGRNRPIMVEGISRLDPGDGSSGAVSELTEYDVPPRLHPKIVTPNVLFWQLQAQTEIYRCLGIFADTINDLPRAEVEREPLLGTDSDIEGNTLVTRSSRSRYLCHTMSVNLQDVQDTIRTSLDEAMDHLWQVRQDAAYWYSCMTGMAKGSGPKELLAILFGRIDTLSTLDQLVATAVQQAKHPLLTDAEDDDIKIASTLDSALRSAFEERLLHFRWIKTPPQGSLTKAGHRLLDMVREDDPVLRCMGFPEVMRTINRETDGARSFPMMVSQTLSDLHVLAACLEETGSHFLSISDWMQHSKMVDCIDAGQTSKPRPWLEILDKAVRAMTEAKEYNFAGGHWSFWRRLDQQMKTVSQNDKALEHVFSPLTVATASQLKQTRRRRARQQNSEPDRSTVQSTKRPLCTSSSSPQLHVRLEEPGFWFSLQNGTQQTFSWNDFRDAMCSIGCSMEPAGGSAFRFACCDSKGKRIFSIVYHKPHNESGETSLSLGQARRSWLKRLERRVIFD